MAKHRTDPLTPQDAVDLAPLRNSHEANALEGELKALFMGLFDAHVRPAERVVNTVGVPHLGDFEQVERAVKAEGLALRRRGSEAALRYLFRSWRARNPKRGLHMLRAYLQLLWPNAWTINQMWFDPSGTYAQNSSDLYAQQEGESRFLTSRVHVEIDGGATGGSDVLAVAPALRSVLPARIVLYMLVASKTNTEMLAAAGFASAANIQYFTGEFVRPANVLAAAAGWYEGAVVHSFNGSFH